MFRSTFLIINFCVFCFVHFWKITEFSLKKILWPLNHKHYFYINPHSYSWLLGFYHDFWKLLIRLNFCSTRIFLAINVILLSETLCSNSFLAESCININYCRPIACCFPALNFKIPVNYIALLMDKLFSIVFYALWHHYQTSVIQFAANTWIYRFGMPLKGFWSDTTLVFFKREFHSC